MSRTNSTQATPPGCGEAGYFSYLTFSWINPLVNTGIERQVNLADAPALAPDDDTLVNTRRLITQLEYTEKNGKSHPLLRAVVYAFWPWMLLLQVLKIISHFLTLLHPLLLKRILVFQEEQNADDLDQAKKQDGFHAVFELCALGLFTIVYNSQLKFFQERLSTKIGSALRGVVLLRSIQHGGNRNGSAPAVYNVISFDVGPNVEIIWIILGLWLFPITFTSTLVVLFGQVAWAVVPGVITILFAKSICFVLLIRDGYLRDRLLKAKDVRLGRCDEGFNNVRTLQMLSWVQPFEERIMAARREELDVQCSRLWMTKMVAALDYSLHTIVTLVTLGYYVFTSGVALKASLALPVIGLVSSLAAPFGEFPVWAQQYLVWKSAYGRVNDYMGLSTNGDARERPQALTNRGQASSSSLATFESGTLAWTPAQADCVEAIDVADDEEAGMGRPLLQEKKLAELTDAFALRDVNLQIRPGETLVLVGREGQGKSSMLQALLGEMQLHNGSVNSPAVARKQAEQVEGAALDMVPGNVSEAKAIVKKAEADNAGEPPSDSSDMEERAALIEPTVGVSPLSVPFASQSATLFTGTVRSNILFGAPHRVDTYAAVIKACALEQDLETMPAGDLTDIAQGGATLSGGQRSRIGLARAAYFASLASVEGRRPLVLLDDPFCALDRKVAREVCEALFASPHGLLSNCAVVVATADAWWVPCLPSGGNATSVRLAVLRQGRVAVEGREDDLRSRSLPELGSLEDSRRQEQAASTAAPPPAALLAPSSNPQEDEAEPEEDAAPQQGGDDADAGAGMAPRTPPPHISSTQSSFRSTDTALKLREGATQTKLTSKQKKASTVVQEEKRQSGSVQGKTYHAYFSAVGYKNLGILSLALSSIMVFQNLCALLLAYWTAEPDEKKGTFMYTWASKFVDHPTEDPSQLFKIYACFVVGFTLSNFAGHALEITGGMGAARLIFTEALTGTLAMPWRWWDANPTGRVLNRFSEDVEVMDNAITNIMGVIFGALLFFVGHSFILFLSNPFALCLLPAIACALEYFAQYYRSTIRELQRIYLVCMGRVYQSMVEAIVGKTTVNAYDSARPVFCFSMAGLDDFQRVNFTKFALNAWLTLRMSLIGYTLSVFAQFYPILQFYGYLPEQTAALVGFSIAYSTETVSIIEQFITNYSALEMQLISIERLREYSNSVETRERIRVWENSTPILAVEGLKMQDVTVRYRAGLPPALSGVNLSFAPGEVVAIKGRTGAGKSSLLLSVLQLVPHDGRVIVDGEDLSEVSSEDVRRRLVGIVPQQPIAFAGDIRWNLDPERVFTDDDLWRALDDVGLGPFIRTHPHGLSAVIARGSGGKTEAEEAQAKADAETCSIEMAVRDLGLSQGQQQLLCAARALLRRPRVVLLDEVTASLPSEVADATVGRLVARFKEYNATVLMVTHQENLLSVCDRIVTIAAGRVESDERQRAL